MENFNLLAFIAAVVAQILVGVLWFHPAVMGKMWAKANGISLEDMKPKNPMKVYGFSILYTLLFTLFLFTNVTGPGQDAASDGHSYHTFQHGLAHGLFLTLLVVLPIIGTPAVYQGKSKSWMLVQVGYWMVRLIVAAGIISAWR